ncbi:MAG: CARDB domain-containing protein [Anaerolineae bacterium]
MPSLERFAAVQPRTADRRDQILDDIAVISDTALNIIDQASKEINTTIDHAADKLKEVIIVATESGAALIDRSADRLWQIIFGIVGLVALIVVGIGFFSMRSAATLGKFQIIGLVLLGVVFLIGVSGVTVPSVRTFILSRTAAQAADKKLVALTQPYISFVFPKKLVASTDAQMRILGGKLPTQGNPPVVKIGGTVVNIATRNDREIVVDVPATVFTTVGIASVTVKFDTMADEMGTSVEFTAPRADLTVSAITFSPTSPRTGQRVTISVTVQNQGQGVAPEFEVAWQPKASLDVQPLTQVITNLEAGQSKVITFSFTYTDSGAMQTTASVNQDRKTRETNTANNRLSVTLQVQPPAPTKTPTRTPRPTRDPDNPLPPICDTKPNLPQCQPKP